MSIRKVGKEDERCRRVGLHFVGTLVLCYVRMVWDDGSGLLSHGSTIDGTG